MSLNKNFSGYNLKWISLFVIVSFIPICTVVFIHLNNRVHNIESGDLKPSLIIHKVDSFLISPLTYSGKQTLDGQYSFKSSPNKVLYAKLIPNKKYRLSSGIKQISNIIGVTHFFLDHDLASGFVHPYTRNFFNKLRPNDFVLKFERINSGSNIGAVRYVRKKDIGLKDVLGYNIGFFRQWKLSEIDINGDLINVKKCSYNNKCVCPQVKAGSNTPFKSEIPIWQQFDKEGYINIDNFTKLGNSDGGTAVIIWDDPVTNEILFMDVHSSLKDIITTAKQIAIKYNVDPVIAISDAGAFSTKYKSDENYSLKTNILDNISGDLYGAGFGYIPEKIVVFEYSIDNKNFEKLFVPENGKLYKLLSPFSLN